MTLVCELVLDIVKMSYHTKNEVSMSRHSKVIACTGTHTDRHTHTHRQYKKHYLPAYGAGKKTCILCGRSCRSLLRQHELINVLFKTRFL